MKVRRFLVVTSAVLLTACGAEVETDSQEAQPVGTASSQKKSGFTEVDIEKFDIDGSTMLKYSTGGSEGTCILTEQTAMCGGTPPADVPDITAMPFSGRPTSVTAQADGVSYYFMEGIRSAEAQLNPGEKVTLGDVTCVASSESEFGCSAAGGWFVITGPQRLISTDSRVVEWVPPSYPISPTTQAEVPTTQMKAKAIKCGKSRHGEEIEIWSGDISCEDAIKVMDHYVDISAAQGTGNTMSLETEDGWSCLSPTYKSAEEKGISRSCWKDDIDIAVPLKR